MKQPAAIGFPGDYCRGVDLQAQRFADTLAAICSNQRSRQRARSTAMLVAIYQNKAPTADISPCRKVFALNAGLTS